MPHLSFVSRNLFATPLDQTCSKTRIYHGFATGSSSSSSNLWWKINSLCYSGYLTKASFVLGLTSISIYISNDCRMMTNIVNVCYIHIQYIHTNAIYNINTKTSVMFELYLSYWINQCYVVAFWNIQLIIKLFVFLTILEQSSSPTDTTSKRQF